MYNAGVEEVMLAYDVQHAPLQQQDHIVYVILAVVAVISLSWSCAYFLHTNSRTRVSLAQTDVGGGLNPAVINTLFPAQVNTQSRDVCAICLENLTCASQVRVLPCKHVFDVLCIDRWFLHHTVTPT